MFNRLLSFVLSSKQSAFFWGARQTGKSTYLKTHFPHSVVINLLKPDIFLAMSKRPSFSRFLDSMAFCNGEMINHSNIARDCGIDAKTVQNYFEILVDTLVGYYLPPYAHKVSRDILSQKQKFYLFDVGVAGYLANRSIEVLKGAEAGKAFEHFIFMELIAYKNMHDKRFKMSYWRTKNGYEVDFILGDALRA